MALAAGLRLPLVLVIDTAGPALSAEAEQGGLAGEIARCLAELVTLDTPTVSVLLGPGQRRTRRWRWCPPTGCWPRCTAGSRRCRRRGPARSSTATPTTPRNWLRRKAFGRPTCCATVSSTSIVPEHPDAADEPMEFTHRLSATIANELHALRGVPDSERLPARLNRYRRIGLP